MRFVPEKVDEWVDEAKSVERDVKQAYEQVSQAREYAENGYDLEAEEQLIEPEVALAFHNPGEYKDSVDHLRFEGITRAFINRRVRTPEEEIPDNKHGYVTRQLKKYEETRKNARDYLGELEDEVEALESSIETEGGIDEPEWDTDDVMSQLGDEVMDNFESRRAARLYIEENF